jgi:hypothetical protein
MCISQWREGRVALCMVKGVAWWAFCVDMKRRESEKNPAILIGKESIRIRMIMNSIL